MQGCPLRNWLLSRRSHSRQHGLGVLVEMPQELKGHLEHEEYVIERTEVNGCMVAGCSRRNSPDKPKRPAGLSALGDDYVSSLHQRIRRPRLMVPSKATSPATNDRVICCILARAYAPPRNVASPNSTALLSLPPGISIASQWGRT